MPKVRAWLAVALATLHLGSAIAACDKPVYLSFDTGHMGVAPLIADVLKRHHIQATFFMANEPTLAGGHTLDDAWAPWWRERAAEGHDFGAHTWDHDIWVADLPDGRFRFKINESHQEPADHSPGASAPIGHVHSSTRFVEMSGEEYCASLNHVAQRFEQMTGKALAPIFRAPAGHTSPALLAAAKRCGFEHVGWSEAGFLGDELNSDRYPNKLLLERALRDIKPGDILLAHLGIWSRQDPWAPAVLEPLIEGLESRGMCFLPMRDNPRYAAWIDKGLKP